VGGSHQNTNLSTAKIPKFNLENLKEAKIYSEKIFKVWVYLARALSFRKLNEMLLPLADRNFLKFKRNFGQINKVQEVSA